MDFDSNELALIQLALHVYRMRANLTPKAKAKAQKLADKILMKQMGLEI